MSKRKLATSIFLVTVVFIFLLVWSNHYAGEQNKAWLDSRERYAKHEFRLVIHEVENRKINKVPDFQETRNIATSAWKKYLLRASSEKYPFVKSYEMNEINGIIAIKAELDGTAALRELRVWIPQKTVSDSNYVATAFFDAEINNVHRRIIMLYTPSMPGRLYVAPVEVNSQEWVSFERQIESYNWKEPFPIAPEVWKESDE